MCRKLIFLVSLVLVLGLVNIASAGIAWDGGAPDNNSWCDPLNWAPNIVPGSTNDVNITPPPEQGPIVEPMCNVDVWRIHGPRYDSDSNQVMDITGGTVLVHGEWRWARYGDEGTGIVNISGASNITVKGLWRFADEGNGVLNISGGDVTVGEFRWGDNTGAYGIVNISGGSVTCSRIKLADDGGGEINISGVGTLTVNGELDLHGGDKNIVTINDSGLLKVIGEFQVPGDGGGGGNVTVNLDAGTIDCGMFVHDAEPWALDINEGILIIDGNVVADVNEDIDSGYITAYNDEPGSQVHVEYDAISGKTKVWATTIMKKAWDPSPENFADDLCPDDVNLVWKPGVYADKHNVYFGSSMDDVNASATAVETNWGPNSWLPPSLELGVIYYWRIDEVNDNGWAPPGSPWRGNVWQFTINDGNAFDPYPANYQTVVPLDVNLHWTPGCTTDSHNVYFGTDYDNVRDGTGGTFRGNRQLDANEYDPCDHDPCGLDYFTVYYWRIDEVDDGNTYKGDVWNFRTQGDINDPNLILWYKLDESQGTSAADSSGYEHRGTIVGDPDPAWEPNDGQINGCLVFREDQGYALTAPVDTLVFPGREIDKQITVSVWVNGDEDQGSEDMPIFDAGDLGDEGTYKLTALIPSKDGDVYWRAGNDSNDALTWGQATPLVWRGDWHHFAFVKDEIADTMKIYFDSEEKESKTGTFNSLANVTNKLFIIGSYNKEQEGYIGRLDDFRIYDYALSGTQIARLFRGEDIELAWAPSPYNGEEDVLRDANLAWKAGEYAADVNAHQLYFGTDYASVRDANTTVTLGVYKGDQNETAYDLPILELETTYYWRIDEVNDVCAPYSWKGKIWGFTVASFLVVDDFEEYGPTNQLKFTWWEYWLQATTPPGIPTGAWLELGVYPQNIVHTGNQSMQYKYKNILHPMGYAFVCYSEAWLPIPAEQRDWTREGVKILTLYFYGDADNDTNDSEQMYVGVEDGDGNYAEVRYGDYDSENEDMNDFKLEEWQVWNIGLPDLNDSNYASVANDVNLADITTLYIGFGNKQNPVCGGEGVVIFDDIRLHLPICKPKYGPVADFTGDCIVNLADAGVIAEHWLLTDANFGGAIEKPNDANLVGWWKLDDGSGNTATDDSGYDNDGTIEGCYMWVTGRNDVNTALKFRRTGGRVLVPDDGDTPELRPQHQVSVSTWVYYSQKQGGSSRVVVKGADNRETFGLEIDSDDDTAFFIRDVNNKSYEVEGEAWRDDWIHLAGTYDGNSVKCYVNGRLEEAKDANFVVVKGWTLSQDANGLAIGNRSDANDNPFKGTIDDVRVYDYALSAAEVAWLASDGTGYVALTAPFNLYDKEGVDKQAINFKDFAVLLESWLEKRYWP